MAKQKPAEIAVPEPLLPSQFFKERDLPIGGEKRLLAALVEQTYMQARYNCTSKSMSGRRRFREAINWFESFRKESIYDFEIVCQMLGFDPDKVRKQILKNIDEIVQGKASRALKRRSVSWVDSSQHSVAFVENVEPKRKRGRPKSR